MTKRITLLSSSLLVASFLAPNIASMASSSSASLISSGALIILKQRQDRANRLVLNEAGLYAEQNLADAEAKYQKASADRRAQCRAELRTANRDTALSITLRCLRNDFQQERAILSKQIALRPLGLTDRAAMKLKDAQTNLSTALMNLTEAIDRGVFREEKLLRDALQNLRAKYRAPLWLAREVARKERKLAGIDLLLIRSMSFTGSVIQTEDWKMSIGCLEAKEAELLGTGSTLAGSGKTLEYCMNKLEESLKTGSGSTASGSLKP